MLGKIIGNYQITGELAPGRLGPVYRGHHLTLAREVVIKTFDFSIVPASTQIQLRSRFRRETFIQTQLDHPNIAHVYEFLAAQETFYLVVEFVPGMSLSELLARQGVPTVAQVAYIARQALAALDYAHHCRYLDESDFRHTGIIHREIRPSSLMLDSRGRLQVTDFGLGKMLGRELLGASVAMQLGVIDYRAPEQARGMEPDARSDLYSLGATLFEVLTGRPPQSGAAPRDARGLVALAEAPSVLELRPGLPPPLAAVIARALKRNPNDRFQSAAEFSQALQACDLGLAAQETGGRVFADRTGSLNPAEGLLNPPLIQVSGLLPERAATGRPAQPLPMAVPTAALVKPPPPLGETAAPNSALNFAHIGPRRREWFLFPVAAGAVLIGTLVGAYFFSSSRNTEGLASNVAPVETAASSQDAASAPVNTSAAPQGAAQKPFKPVAPSPKPTITPLEAAALGRARQAEQEELYGDAIRTYEDYLLSNPHSPNARTFKTRAETLKRFQTLLISAKAASDEAQYQAARQRYAEALRLRPDSKAAQAGVKEAGAKLTETPAAPLNQGAEKEPEPATSKPPQPETGASRPRQLPPQAQTPITKPPAVQQ